MVSLEQTEKGEKMHLSPCEFSTVVNRKTAASPRRLPSVDANGFFRIPEAL